MNSKQNNTTIGSWITLNHISIVEIMAKAGFDWLCVDLEHSVIDYYDLQTLLSTIQAQGLKAYTRVGCNDATIIKRALDAGADGIIAPMINSAQEARELVNNTKYPPIGKRGVGLARAQNYGLDGGFENYRDTVADNITVIAQIEHVNAVDELEEIIAIDGIDGTFIGPYDLSGSMGKPGKYDDADVVAVFDRYRSIAASSGKLMGFHVIQPDHSLLQKKIDEGYNFVAFSIDTLFLGYKCREELQKFKQ